MKIRCKGFTVHFCGDFLISVNVYYKLLGTDNPHELSAYSNEDIRNVIKRYFASEEYLEKKKVDADNCIWAPSIWFCVGDGDFDDNGDSLRKKKDLIVLCDEYISPKYKENPL